MRQHREIAVLEGSPPEEQTQRGRKPLFGAKVTRQVRVWFTDEQFSDFQAVVQSEGKDQSELIRDAVNEYVSDYRERKMFFLQRKPYQPE